MTGCRQRLWFLHELGTSASDRLGCSDPLPEQQSFERVNVNSVLCIYECLGDTEMTTPFKTHTNDITIVVATKYICRYSTNMYIIKPCLDWTRSYICKVNYLDRIQALRLHHSG